MDFQVKEEEELETLNLEKMDIFYFLEIWSFIGSNLGTDGNP